MTADRDQIADYLLTYSISGDRADPWQAGHNYAMQEAARMVRERWDEMAPSPALAQHKADMDSLPVVAPSATDDGTGEVTP